MLHPRAFNRNGSGGRSWAWCATSSATPGRACSGCSRRRSSRKPRNPRHLDRSEGRVVLFRDLPFRSLPLVACLFVVCSCWLFLGPCHGPIDWDLSNLKAGETADLIYCGLQCIWVAGLGRTLAERGGGAAARGLRPGGAARGEGRGSAAARGGARRRARQPDGGGGGEPAMERTPRMGCSS